MDTLSGEIKPFFENRKQESIQLFPVTSIETEVEKRVDVFTKEKIDKNSCKKVTGDPVNLLCDNNGYTGGASLKCEQVFMCGTTTVDIEPSLSITTNQIYVDKTAKLVSLREKAPNGRNGANPGENGGNGESGKNAANILISANQLMISSAKLLTFESKGGDAGNGGDGANYFPHPNFPPFTFTAYDVVMRGIKTYTAPEECYTKDCGWSWCSLYTTYETYKYEYYASYCGGKGGTPGKGGLHGELTIAGSTGLTANSMGVDGKEGVPGKKGDGERTEQYAEGKR